ncbi:CaiB/BaiF CoA-transferase family protein [Aquisalimonas lutea]|uniref:CaiB/BaiF CoA transferase family protein n=1 Tax=Aquisalimonas lutea TaxID=1327750 RepID=UPI0025B43FE2|nr:CaiB/BaiF CoA-transferase family protein [Aquisalimonas lutea]MDN3518812.1 CaiB/BaiF CoA-transferase family protein [Aquisalimonas lutea]
MTKVLEHIRVLDLSRILAGPWAGQLFADLGAEVIKVERPGRGDDTRGWGPPYLEDEHGHPAASAYYLSCNRGKQSVAIDITTADGQALVRELAARSDILLENYKVGGLARYGLDYASLAAVNPGLIYCSITGFGHTGPYRERAGYDFLLQAMGGLMSITGAPDAEGGEPTKAGVALTDILTGMYAAVASLGALAHRERTGEGQHIDLALLDVQVATLANQAMNYLVTGEAPGRMGNAHPNIVPYQTFPTRDGHLVLTVGNDDQFRRLCETMGRPDLPADPRYATNAGRVAGRAELVPELTAVFRTRTTDAWLADLEAAGVPCGPVNSIDRVFADPQVRARGMQTTAEHPQLGPVPGVANPIRYSATPLGTGSPAPGLGEHTDPVLEQVLGYSGEALTALRRRGVID